MKDRVILRSFLNLNVFPKHKFNNWWIEKGFPQITCDPLLSLLWANTEYNFPTHWRPKAQIIKITEFVFTLKGLKLGFKFHLVHFSPIYFLVLQYYCCYLFQVFRSMLSDRNMQSLKTQFVSLFNFILVLKSLVQHNN